MQQPPYSQQPPYPQQPPRSSGGSAVVTVLLILAGLFVFAVCIVPICVIIILALMGPAIGNVFSSIIEDLTTPTPAFILMASLTWFSIKYG